MTNHVWCREYFSFVLLSSFLFGSSFLFHEQLQQIFRMWNRIEVVWRDFMLKNKQLEKLFASKHLDIHIVRSEFLNNREV